MKENVYNQNTRGLRAFIKDLKITRSGLCSKVCRAYEMAVSCSQFRSVVLKINSAFLFIHKTTNNLIHIHFLTLFM